VTGVFAAPSSREVEGVDLSAILGRLPTLFTTTAERVVEVTGTDRITYLDAMTSQAMSTLTAPVTTAGLVLDQNGRALVLFDGVVLEDRVLLLLPDGEAADAAVALLGGRTFLSDARFRQSPVAVIRIHGPRAIVVASEVLGIDDGLTAGPVVVSDGVVAAPDAWGSVQIIGDEDRLRTFVDRLLEHGVPEGTPEEFDTWRVVVGRPAWGREVVGPHLPEELGLLPTHVHLAKGCYPGQEAVARMWMLGRPRRRIAVLAADHAVFAASGTPAQGSEAAVTTVAAPSAIGDPRGRTLALAMVPGVPTVGSSVAVTAGTSALVVGVLGDSATPPGHDPAMRRRRDQQRGDARPPTRPPSGDGSGA